MVKLLTAIFYKNIQNNFTLLGAIIFPHFPFVFKHNLASFECPVVKKIACFID